MKNRKMVQCISMVNKSNIQRQTIDGIEHIIVSSYTLPDDIVMNDVLYPASEIEKGYRSLERTLAPVEHPMNSQGEYISATDPYAINNYYAGAYNINVSRENGRVHIEKHINVAEALKTDRGKRLLDRINELETSEKPRPIHTSVGVFLEVEKCGGKKKKMNAAGQEYSLIARNLIADHDAILLDSIGAATPEQGVGMAVNSSGEKMEVDRTIITAEEKPPSDIEQYLKKIRTNEDGLSYSDILEQLSQEIKNTVAAEWMMIVDLYPDRVIFETSAGYFQAPYTVSGDQITLAGIPIRVDKMVEYQPKVNRKTGDEQMKQMIINALAEAGISTDGLGDDALFAAYNELMTSKKEPDPKTDQADIVNAVNAAMAPITEQIKNLTAQVNASAEKAKGDLIQTIVNSKKYPGMTEDAAKLLPVDTLKEMAANCTQAHGIPLNTNADDNSNAFAAPAEMPE